MPLFQADVFSLGVLMYIVLTSGIHPFDGLEFKSEIDKAFADVSFQFFFSLLFFFINLLSLLIWVIILVLYCFKKLYLGVFLFDIFPSYSYHMWLRSNNSYNKNNFGADDEDDKDDIEQNEDEDYHEDDDDDWEFSRSFVTLNISVTYELYIF